MAPEALRIVAPTSAPVLDSRAAQALLKIFFGAQERATTERGVGVVAMGATDAAKEPAVRAVQRTSSSISNHVSPAVVLVEGN
jgi:hypothetical protein